jgi:Domain of unknown function (DUF4160)
MPAVPGQPCSNHKVRAYIHANEPHARPHFHVVCGDEWDGTICIETGEHIIGEIPAKELREVRAWREANLEVLRSIWREHHGPED